MAWHLCTSKAHPPPSDVLPPTRPHLQITAGTWEPSTLLLRLRETFLQITTHHSFQRQKEDPTVVGISKYFKTLIFNQEALTQVCWPAVLTVVG